MSSRVARTLAASGVWFGAFTLSRFFLDGWTVSIRVGWWLILVGLAAVIIRDAILPGTARADISAQLIACYLGGVLARAFELLEIGPSPGSGATALWLLTGVWPLADVRAWSGLAGTALALCIVAFAAVAKARSASRQRTLG